ncbi:sulfotransferase [Alkalicaulis satelles]|nr:sulfotransferase [Alkalicaulis satelles]
MTALLGEALGLLQARYSTDEPAPPAMALAPLLKACWARAQARAATGPEPVRVVRQFACTGGTLFARALQAQPNTVVLSELDPFAVRPGLQPDFAPSDLIYQADMAAGPLDDASRADVFSAGFRALHDALTRRGSRIVARVHSHTRYCTARAWDTRPGVTAVLSGLLPVRVLTLVRHPLDSWLALQAHGWVHFQPGTLEEYARRYGAFLDQPEAGRVVKYETFVSDPRAILQWSCEWLELAHNPDWPDLLPAIRLSGASGRKGDVIAARPRRAVPADLVSEAAASPAYEALCTRLGYHPDPAAPAIT